MTLRHLAVFTAVADCGCSITKAADKLHTAQPAVSQTIADLESYYGIQLFDRLNRRLFLTPAGERLLLYSRRLVDSFDELDGIMKNTAGTLPLRIGASFTVSIVLLPQILQRFAGSPAVVTVLNTAELETAVIESRLDAAVVEGSIQSPDIVQIPLAQDTLVCAASPAYAERMQSPHLADAVFILREKGSGTRSQTDRMMEAEKLAPHIWNAANTQSITVLVKAGLGATVISRSLIADELAAGSLVEYPVFHGDCTRTFRLVYHKDKFIDIRMKSFKEACGVLEQ